MRPFVWDSNAAWGDILTEEQLKKLFELVPDAEKGRECVRREKDVPKFGFRAECAGRRTLAEYLSGEGCVN